MSVESIIEGLRESEITRWGQDKEGKRRADHIEEFLRKMLPEYSKALELTEEEILTAFEKRRDYVAINYYQLANFPDLEGVTIYATQQALHDAIADHRFRCPSCHQASTHPYVCNSGHEIDGGGKCDWKSYGLFGTLGKGFHFTIKEAFLEKPYVDEIFMPLIMEEEAS